MTTFIGKSAAIANGTTSVAPAYPTGLAAGDLLVLCITNKYPTNKPTIPAGWTLAPDLQQSGGSGASGIDTGSVYCTVMTKRATGAESGSLTVTITSGNSAVAVILAYRPTAGKQFALSYCGGADNTAGTAWSVTGNVNPGLDAGDWVIVASAINTDGYTYLSEAISATGTTWGTVTERFDGGTISGQDCGIVVSDHVVSTGPSTAAPVFTMTASSSGTNNPAGASCMLRLREVGDLSATVTPASDVWPKQAAPNANNFLDHFPGSSLASQWTAVTSGTGSVTVTDSKALCASGATAGSADFFYRNTKLDLTKKQLWMVCMDPEFGTMPSHGLFLYNKVTAPAAATSAAWHTDVRAYASVREGASTDELRLHYYSSAHVETFWDGVNNQWTTTAAAAYAGISAGARVIVGIEIDGASSRFRYHAWAGQGTFNTYDFNSGWRLLATTDWVPLQSLESTSDLWLVLGNPLNDNATTNEWWFDWVRYAEATTVLDAWTGSKTSTSTFHHTRHHYSYDGLIFVPEDRSTDALAPTGAGWESAETQAPRVVYDGNATDYLFYWGADSSFATTGIGVAKATHATPQSGPWTRGASNPILSPDAGMSQIRYFFPLKDNGEPDANKRWKLLYVQLQTSDSKKRLYLATAPDPPDTSTWTKQGVVLDVGGAGSPDEKGIEDCAVVQYNGLWEVWYTGFYADSTTSLMRATGSTLASLTKDGQGQRLAPSSAIQSLTANLAFSTVTVASTTGFVPDGFVLLDQDADAAQYNTSRIRTVDSSTQLTLYHPAPGFTTTTPAKIRQIDSHKYFDPRTIVRVGSEWWLYGVQWGGMDDQGASYGALLEQNVLYTHSNAAPSGATFAINQLVSPITSRGYNSDERSVENIGLRLPPVTPYRDAVTRFRLRVTAFRDVAARFVLQAGAAAVYRDATARLRLAATIYRDATSRLRLQVAAYRDVALRLRLAVSAFRDATARLALRATAYRDASARLRLRVAAFRDAGTRLVLRATAFRDATSRLRLQVAAFRDAAVRLRLQVAVIRDVVTRLRLRVTAFRDGAARVRLAVTAFRDAGSRFRVAVQRTVDAAIRARLRAVVLRDGLLRFRLSTSTVSTVGRATSTEAGSGTARATDATLGTLTGAMMSSSSLVAGESAGLSS